MTTISGVFEVTDVEEPDGDNQERRGFSATGTGIIEGASLVMEVPGDVVPEEGDFFVIEGHFRKPEQMTGLTSTGKRVDVTEPGGV